MPGRPREVDLREVLDAILYLLRTGCPWRLLPKSFPPKSTVFGYFRRLWEDGTWPTLHALLVMAARRRRRACASRPARASPARAASPSCRVDGWWNGPSRGWAATGGWPRTSRPRSPPPSRWPTSPPSSSSCDGSQELETNQLVRGRALSFSAVPASARKERNT